MVKFKAEQDAVFSALANATRRSILERLRSGARSISELAEPFDMSLVAVSKHVHRLEDVGLVRIRREGRTRFCHLNPAPLRAGDRWMEQFRSFWRSELDQVDRWLRGTGSGGEGRAGDAAPGPEVGESPRAGDGGDQDDGGG